MRSAIQTIKDIAAGRQNARLLRLTFPGNDGPDAILLPERFDATESVSRDFICTTDLLSDRATIPLSSMPGRSVTISLEADNGRVRYFNGQVSEPCSGQTAVSPGTAWRSGPGWRISADVFNDYPAVARWRSDVTGEMPVITRSCQHNETDFNYLSRHWEAAGWHYRYEHTVDGPYSCPVG